MGSQEPHLPICGGKLISFGKNGNPGPPGVITLVSENVV